jgi:hypothetical protein
MHMTIGTNEMGFVAVTDDAILSVQTRTANEAGAGVVGGAVGALVAGALERRKAGPAAPAARLASLAGLTKVQTCTVAELPADVCASAGWPRGVEPHRPVVVFPRQAVQEVKASIWRGLIVKSGGKTFYTAIQMWQTGKVKRHLQAARYRLG